MPLLNKIFRKRGPIRNPALERAMHEVAQSDNAKTRESLYKAILASTFVVQGSISGTGEAHTGKWIADSSTRVAFKTIEHPLGTIVLPAFTDVEALTSWAGSEVQWMALRARELFQSIMPGNIAEVRVNPFRPEQRISRPAGIITRSEFMVLAQGLLPEVADPNVARLKIAAGKKLFIGAPTIELPNEVLDALTGYLQEFPELRNAYLFQVVDQNVTSRVIGLQFDAEPGTQKMDLIMRGVSQVISGVLPVGISIDFMPLTAGPFLDSVQKYGKAFLKR